MNTNYLHIMLAPLAQKKVLGIFVCLLWFNMNANSQSQTKPPNIVWITTEDMSPRLGCYGDSMAQTPHIDQLAAEGLLYTNAFSISGVCSPSRSALITGCYPTSIGTMHHRTTTKNNPYCEPYVGVPPPEVKGFTEYLRAAGYYCTNNSKTDYQFGLPFTIWDESGSEAHWVNRPDPDQPFFAVFNSTTTHESKLFPAHTANEVADSLEQEGKNAGHYRALAKWNPEKVTDPEEVFLPPYYPENDVFRKDVARMYDNIHLMDQWVGERVSELEKAGLLENTIVFFFSDHGSCLPRGKRWLYDSGIKVPLIIRWPGTLAAGSETERMVSFVDFGPTVISLAGIKLPDHMQGVPFLGAQDGEEREYIYAARDRTDELLDQIRAIRDKRYKFIHNLSPDIPYSYPLSYAELIASNPVWRELHRNGELSGPPQRWFESKPVEELYDLTKDPHEVNNLIDDPALKDKVSELRHALAAWRGESGDMGERPEAEIRQQMYPDGQQPVTPSPTISMKDHHWHITTAAGASIGYQFIEGEENTSHWLLYSGPVEMKEEVGIRTKAIRYGYKESEVVENRP